MRARKTYELRTAQMKHQKLPSFCRSTVSLHFFPVRCKLIMNNHSNASLWVLTRDAYWPLLANNSEWVPSSATFPSEHSAIWWAFWTVLNLWAITNDVLPFIRWSSASCTKRSLTASKALVACTMTYHEKIRSVSNGNGESEASKTYIYHKRVTSSNIKIGAFLRIARAIAILYKAEESN